jgi:hypothetical protein
MFRHWKIVALLLVICVTCSFARLFLTVRLLDVVVRLVELVGKLGGQ